MPYKPELSVGGKLLVMLLIIVMLFAAKIIYASVVYHDWTCAFAQCVKVQDNDK